ncbi:unnamed protein product [Prunus brigantina]
MGARFSSRAIPGSLAVTRGNPCKFLFLRLLICLNSAGNPARPRGRVESRAGAQQFFRALDARRPHTTGNRGFATTDCRGVRRRRGLGIYANRAARRTGGHHPPPEGVDGGQRRVTPGRGRALGLMASGATCVQRLDGSRDSAIHTKYRISLRSSSMREPRYPLPRVVLTYLKMTTPPAHTVSGATRTRSLVQVPWRNSRRCSSRVVTLGEVSTMILPRVHLRKPCYDFSFL